MSDEIDIHEPEHDHLLDHEFHDDEESWVEEDAQGLLDDDQEDDGLEDLDLLDQEGWDDNIERLNDI